MGEMEAGFQYKPVHKRAPAPEFTVQGHAAIITQQSNSYGGSHESILRMSRTALDNARRDKFTSRFCDSRHRTARRRRRGGDGGGGGRVEGDACALHPQ